MRRMGDAEGHERDHDEEQSSTVNTYPNDTPTTNYPPAVSVTIQPIPGAALTGPVSGAALSAPAATADSRTSPGVRLDAERATTEIESGPHVVPPVTLFNAYSDEQGSNNLPPPPTSKLELDLVSNNYSPVDVKGFNEQRPEIIAEFAFQPAFSVNTNDDDVSPGPIAEMLDTQISMRHLRAENVAKLFNELRNDPDAAVVIDELERRRVASVNEAKEESQFLLQMVNRLKFTKEALSVKSNALGIHDDVVSRDSSLANVDILNDLMINGLGFSESYKKFSDTKIIAQMLQDLLTTIKSTTPSATVAADRDRLNDSGQFNINKTYVANNNFDVSSFRSMNNDLLTNKSSLSDFNKSVESLTDFDDKLAVLLAFLSKELRVSSGLNVANVYETIKQSFGLADSDISFKPDVFDKIIGVPGQTIFERPAGVENSVAKLLYIITGLQQRVLPFESTFISNSTTNHTPGHKFYVDSITRGDEKFKTTSLQNYAKAFSSIVESLATIIEGTFDVNVINNSKTGLNADNMLKIYIRTLSAAFDHSGVAAFDGFTSSLLALAADDEELKHLLTLYITYVGVRDAVRPGAPYGIFNAIIDSLNTAGSDSLSGVSDAIRAIDSNVAGNDIDIISQLILNRVYTLTSNTSATVSVDFSSVSVTATMNSALNKLTSISSNDPTFLLKSIINTVNTFDNFARNVSLPKPYHIFSVSLRTGDEDAVLTSFNAISLHTIVRIVIELFTSFFKSYRVATFLPSIVRNGVRVFSTYTDPSVFISTKESLHALSHATSLPVSLESSSASRATSVIARFNSILETLKLEDTTIKKIMNVLLAISNTLKFQSAATARFFDTTGANATLLSSVLASDDSNEKLEALDTAQCVLSAMAMLEHDSNSVATRAAATSELGGNSTITPFVDDSVIAPTTRLALNSMLRSAQFMYPEGSNVRILTVGLPTGFMESMRKRVDSYAAGQSFSNFSRLTGTRNDVVKIHVYLKDLMFEDVVFLPQTFIFQLGRFCQGSSFENVIEQTNFNTIVNNKAKLIVSSNDASSVMYERGAEIASDPGYDGVLDSEQKIEMASNHVKSYLLNVYIKLLTGIDFSEDGFYINDTVGESRVDVETQELFKNLLVTRVSGFLGRKITFDELLASNESVKKLLARVSDVFTAENVGAIKTVFNETSKKINIEIADDLLNFTRVFSSNSALFGSGSRRKRVVSPKLFERIFHIPVDVDNFIIDMQQTNSTTTGKALMDSEIVRSILEVNDSISPDQQSIVKFNRDVRDELGNIELRQYFVVIEQLPESPKDEPVTYVIRGNVQPIATEVDFSREMDAQTSFVPNNNFAVPAVSATSNAVSSGGYTTKPVKSEYSTAETAARIGSGLSAPRGRLA